MLGKRYLVSSVTTNRANARWLLSHPKGAQMGTSRCRSGRALEPTGKCPRHDTPARDSAPLTRPEWGAHHPCGQCGAACEATPGEAYLPPRTNFRPPSDHVPVIPPCFWVAMGGWPPREQFRRRYCCPTQKPARVVAAGRRSLAGVCSDTWTARPALRACLATSMDFQCDRQNT